MEQQPVIAQLSSSGREVFVAQQQAGKGFLLVYDVASKQVLDVYKVGRGGGWTGGVLSDSRVRPGLKLGA